LNPRKIKQQEARENCVMRRASYLVIPNIISMNKLRGMKLVGHVVCMGEEYIQGFGEEKNQ
jgi:PHP family Zn ribbon phosphoesterase